MNIPLQKMQAYCRLDGIIYDVNEVRLNETPQIVVLNRIRERTYCPISGKKCEVFIMNERADYLEEIHGKTLFDLDFVAFVSEKKELVITLLGSHNLYSKLLGNHKIYNLMIDKHNKIIRKLKKKSDEYFELFKNTENSEEKCIEIGNLFDYLDQYTINQLFKVIKK